jgi:hypothetical protein
MIPGEASILRHPAKRVSPIGASVQHAAILRFGTYVQVYRYAGAECVESRSRAPARIRLQPIRINNTPDAKNR